ncbi:MAG: DNA topoisomerase, partial [Proteobacteria bacterium]|nr:DNA topoisomerase [Pseudomonadota bacterium]
MAKHLIITEKPSVARDIASALAGFSEEQGYFESETWVLTWAVGHLFELLEPEEIDPEYKRWTLANLPIIPEVFKTKPKQGQAERVRTIKKLLERSDVEGVVNACDAGREGELIFREIVEHFGSTKPIRRLWLQSMTEDAIRDGFSRLRPGEELENLAAAARARTLTDWLIGMNATRAFTKRLKGRREKGAWSAGRVQTPTLALLVERELEVLAHNAKGYWRLVGSFELGGQSYAGTWFDPALAESENEEARDDRIFDESRANAIVAAISGRPGVADETRKPSRETAPPLFDLTSLQREAIRRFGWTARRTLSAAQRCYEAHKILTYPRTDSRCLPNDYRQKVREVLHALADAGRDLRPS